MWGNDKSHYRMAKRWWGYNGGNGGKPFATYYAYIDNGGSGVSQIVQVKDNDVWLFAGYLRMGMPDSEVTRLVNEKRIVKYKINVILTEKSASAGFNPEADTFIECDVVTMGESITYTTELGLSYPMVPGIPFYTMGVGYPLTQQTAEQSYMVKDGYEYGMVDYPQCYLYDYGDNPLNGDSLHIESGVYVYSQPTNKKLINKVYSENNRFVYVAPFIINNQTFEYKADGKITETGEMYYESFLQSTNTVPISPAYFTAPTLQITGFKVTAKPDGEKTFESLLSEKQFYAWWKVECYYG